MARDAKSRRSLPMRIARTQSALTGVMGRAFVVAAVVLITCEPLAGKDQRPPQGPLRADPPHVSTDKTVKYDYDIVYVRAPRGDKGKARWAEVGDPRTMEPGADLMLL